MSGSLGSDREGEERETVVAKVKELSGGTSFPVVVLDDGEVIVGFNKVRLTEKLLQG